VEERRRIDSFDEEIGSIQEELSEILRERATLHGEIEGIQARDLELDHQQRMKRASHEIRLMQFERERVEEYEREHRRTFESWSEKYGEDKATRLVQEQLKEIEQLHRKQGTFCPISGVLFFLMYANMSHLSLSCMVVKCKNVADISCV
jgi:hypothetical protein